MSQRDDRSDELNVDGVGRVFPAQSAEEGTVELELVEGQLSQVGEVGVAGAEVVDGQPYPHVGERVERVTGERVGADDGALGDLELELLRVQPAVGERRADVVDQVLVPELPAGEVDADERASATSPEPGERLPAGSPEHAPAEGDDHPRLLRQAHEALGAEEPHARVLPPD